MKAPIFSAYVRRHDCGEGWRGTLAMPEARSLYGHPRRAPFSDNTRAGVIRQAIDLAALYQHERDPVTGDLIE